MAAVKDQLYYFEEEHNGFNVDLWAEEMEYYLATLTPEELDEIMNETI